MKCDLCNFETDVKEKYAGHRSSHVRRGELMKRPPRGSWKHICKYCNLEFPNGSGLGGHIQSCGTQEMKEERFRKGRVGTLRISLIRLGRKHECELCNLGPTWNDLPLTLQVDHIDGNNKNHAPENLRFLCPNCHTQTPTYSNKKRV